MCHYGRRTVKIQSPGSDTILESAGCNYLGSFLYGLYNKYSLPESDNTKPQFYNI